MTAGERAGPTPRVLNPRVEGAPDLNPRIEPDADVRSPL